MAANSMLFERYIQDKCNVEVQSEAMYILFVRHCQILYGLYSLAFLGWKDYSIYSNVQHLWVPLKFGVYYGVFAGLSTFRLLIWGKAVLAALRIFITTVLLLIARWDFCLLSKEGFDLLRTTMLPHLMTGTTCWNQTMEEGTKNRARSEKVSERKCRLHGQKQGFGGSYGEFWQNMIHWRRKWQTTSVKLLWEVQGLHKKAKRYDTKRWVPPGCKVSNVPLGKSEVQLHSSRNNDAAGPKQKWCSAVDMSGDESKIWCCKEQYCIGTWNFRSMNEGKLDVVKQEMAIITST